MTQRASDRLADKQGPRPCVKCGGSRRDHHDGSVTIRLADGHTEQRECTGYVPPAKGTVLMGAR